MVQVLLGEGSVLHAAPSSRGACAVLGCGRVVRRRSWCRGHYARVLQHGDPLAAIPLQDADARPPLERYELAPDGCWLWNGRLNASGYGVFHQTPAHRLVYELLVGPIPDGLVLDHLCRVRHCVNPDHLEPITQEENMRRARLTSCRRGHPLSDDNVYVTPSTGSRTCLTCKRAWRPKSVAA